jgi:hypothetical protein
MGMLQVSIAAGAVVQIPLTCRGRFTPSAGAHTYSVRAVVEVGTAYVQAPGFLRFTKV